MKKKVIIDCDPGIDDALALAAAFAAEELEVLAVTTVAGNVGAEITARNALALSELMGQKCPVAAGAEGPLSGANREAGHVHGKNGLGNVDLPLKGSLSAQDSSKLLYKLLSEGDGDIEIIALAPLTNLALLLEKHPEIINKIPRLTLMGGSLGKGNATAHAEFNFYADPLAADRVLRSGIPIDMYGLDVTNHAPLYGEDVEHLEALGGPVLEPVCRMIHFYKDFYESVGHKAMKLHDPLAVVGSFMPELTEMKRFALGVETEDPVTLGKVLILDDGTQNPSVRVAMLHDQETFIDTFLELLSRWGT